MVQYRRGFGLQTSLQVGESKDAYHGATDAVINIYSMDSAVDVSDVAEIWNGNRYFVGQLHLQVEQRYMYIQVFGVGPPSFWRGRMWEEGIGH